MSVKANPKIALVGNPNSGKSSLFNQLTGLNQKVGNFPGVTVEKKTGQCRLNEHAVANIVDLPGTYSIYPRSPEETIVFDTLVNTENPDHPDMAVVIVDVSNLKRNLLLFTQVRDLGIPVVLALNMVDLATQQGIEVQVEQLKKELGVQVVPINARKGKGLDKLKHTLSNPIVKECVPMYDVDYVDEDIITNIRTKYKHCSPYPAYLLLQNFEKAASLDGTQQAELQELHDRYPMDRAEQQVKEIMGRYELIDKLISKVVTYKTAEPAAGHKVTDMIDKWVTHRVWGYLLFFVVLTIIFQAIFAWSSWPMDMIDLVFGEASAWVAARLPEGTLSGLLTEGIIPGIGGVVIFIPQIAFLFAFIALLEESGYMARVVYLMDKPMRKAGLNGKSVVPLISGMACAIPAIMATRTIENRKDRLITIFVTPLTSCSARLPVYVILIALVVPSTRVLGIINVQGLVLMGLYLLGFVGVFFTAWLMKRMLKIKERSFLIMEHPPYRWPRLKNVLLTIYEKVKVFVWEAGRVILAISIILYVLGTYGPRQKMEEAATVVAARFEGQGLTAEELEKEVTAYKLEQSYAGRLGHFIEPVIKPLGYDWKIGIALITSFAAREVFVGSMATIYSLGTDVEDDDPTIKQRLKAVVRPDGTPFFDLATALSLLVYYVFAMQCMSTLAVVYRETKGWKWPLLQVVYMLGLAYLSALIVYQVLA